MSESLSLQARLSVEQGNWRDALSFYEELQRRVPSRTWEREIARLRDRVRQQAQAGAPPLREVLRSGLGIEQIYAINLARRPDRMVRLLRELSHQGLGVTRIDAVDAATSPEAARVHDTFRRRRASERMPSSAHVSDAVMARYRKSLSPGVFGYLLSQARAVRHARRLGHRRILLLDDDVFFASDAASRLTNLLPDLPAEWKILLLGASEYADRNGAVFNASRTRPHGPLYHPIAGETCGSFAVAYDESVYDDLEQAIGEADGTFDNVVLGSLYRAHRERCFAIDPAVCIPDVSDSDIRDGARAQKSHSERMNWEFERYAEFRHPLTVAVLVSDFRSLRAVEAMRSQLPGAIYLNIYYASEDGLRPVIPGRRFAPRDERPKMPSVRDGEGLRRAALDLRVPHADLVLHWPGFRLLTDDDVLAAYAKAMERCNADGTTEGQVDGIFFCLDGGVEPTPRLHSIVIPCYRSAEHVWPTILSALSQDTGSFEVVVVNDNPDDTTFSADILHRVLVWQQAHPDRHHPTFRVHDHAVNRNASAARNTGFLLSSGEWVSFLDDDDHFDPHRLQCVDAALVAAGPDVGACYCGYEGAWNGQRDESRFPTGNLGSLVLGLRYSAHYMCTNTVTFRRSAFARLCGFNESYRRHQDLELMVRFFNEFEITAVNTFAVRNRPNPVPETFQADLAGLCRLKQQFLHDFRHDIVSRGDAFVEEVVTAHARDITKRDRSLAPNALGIVDAFLRSALGR